MILTVSDLAESLSPAEAAQREDGDSSTEEREPSPAPKKKREKQQEIFPCWWLLMNRSRQKAPFWKYIYKLSSCWLLRHIQNQHCFAVNRQLASCVRFSIYYFRGLLLRFCISLMLHSVNNVTYKNTQPWNSKHFLMPQFFLKIKRKWYHKRAMTSRLMACTNDY